ncbi:KAP family P-loop NTPase fold protein [Thiococcus pfennigii]|uniref:KAP family P-loop NTPase fold protein n=1 Tax=Thiococcus pfennigii TaxID=1057 RepID=UPI0019068560|nr:P-loop NTPase fold protein [Thiococcus pfennigii]
MTDASPHYRNDVWTLDDGFGLGRAGDQVARMALEVEPPFTIGVTGKWGSGKTSVMRRAFVTLGGRPIQQALMFSDVPSQEEDEQAWEAWLCTNEQRRTTLDWPPLTGRAVEQTLCVWYSPWQHQSEGNPLVPLIREIQAQFTTWLKVKEGAKKLNRQGGLAVAKILEHLADAALSLYLGKPAQVARGFTDAVGQGWQAGDEGLTKLSDGQRFHLLFEDAVEQVLKARFADPNRELEQGARLLIFVDDLDRCEGEVIVRLLETIKLYLGTRRCVFILGLDDGAVLDALRKHRSDSDEGNREYLEKLFQAMLAIPLPTETGVRSGIEAQLRAHGIPRPVAPTASSEALGLIETARSKLAADVERLLEPNPRKIKNFVNSLCAAWAMHGCRDWIGASDDFEGEARRFALLHYLRHYHRPVWRLLERQPEALQALFGVLCGAEGFEPISAGDEQGLLREIFFRAFSHVLQTKNPDLTDRHGNESLDEVVKRFHERRDRKRSDDNFRALFRELFDQARRIDPRHIYLVTASEPQARGPSDEAAAPSSGPESDPDTGPNA